jgi:hypothetical protein
LTLSPRTRLILECAEKEHAVSDVAASCWNIAA